MFDPNSAGDVAAAKIRVIGIGGGGCNAIGTMIESGLERVDFIACNTDIQALEASRAPTKIQIGAERTRGLGAGANPEVGSMAAKDSEQEIRAALEGSDMVFVTAGMGGGTGTGGAPVVADIARSMGILTVGVVTKPFVFEGRKRARQADQGIIALRSTVDTLITIPNEKLIAASSNMNLGIREAFTMADSVLLNAVKGISDLIQFRGYINLDFADVRTVMSGRSGMALMGMGIGTGESRVRDAVQQAIASPLLEEASINGAQGILINFTIPESLGLREIGEGISLVNEVADPDAEIIYGTVFSPDPECEEVKVTIIATGFPPKDMAQASLHPRPAVQKMSFPPRPTTPVMDPFGSFGSPYDSAPGSPSMVTPRPPSLPPMSTASIPPRPVAVSVELGVAAVVSSLSDQGQIQGQGQGMTPQNQWDEALDLPLGLQMEPAMTEEERQLQIPTYLRNRK